MMIIFMFIIFLIGDAFAQSLESTGFTAIPLEGNNEIKKIL